jgi:hypothetical protein
VDGTAGVAPFASDEDFMGWLIQDLPGLLEQYTGGLIT